LPSAPMRTDRVGLGSWTPQDVATGFDSEPTNACGQGWPLSAAYARTSESSAARVRLRTENQGSLPKRSYTAFSRVTWSRDWSFHGAPKSGFR
jgi:hypothetical protein